MSRFVLTADTTLDGLTYPRGTIVNAPQELPTVVAHSATLDAVPRARVAGLEYPPNWYIPVPVDDQTGRKTSEPGTPLAPENAIVEPVLPTVNSQYD